MATPLDESLLESGGRRPADASPKPWARALARATAAAAAACGAMLLATGLFLGGAEYGRTTPHTGRARAIDLSARNVTQAGAATNLDYHLNLGCYAYTGGHCRLGPCDTGRGANCEDGVCVCPSHSCTGVDGICHKGAKNRLIATGFTLTNVKYGDQMMYMPATDPFKHIKTTASPSFFNFGTDKWTLYEMPAKTLVGGKKGYLLSSERFPGYVAAAEPTLGEAISPYAAYEVGLYREKAPTDIALRMCSREDGSIMMGSQGWSSSNLTQWFYIHHGSWEVFTWGVGDPGPGGYWGAEPPLPTGALEPCSKL